jgi:hypothetical protein
MFGYGQKKRKESSKHLALQTGRLKNVDCEIGQAKPFLAKSAGGASFRSGAARFPGGSSWRFPLAS